MDERLELLFRHAGLSEKQAKLYRMLLIDGQERVSTLSRKQALREIPTHCYGTYECADCHGI